MVALQCVAMEKGFLRQGVLEEAVNGRCARRSQLRNARLLEDDDARSELFPGKKKHWLEKFSQTNLSFAVGIE